MSLDANQIIKNNFDPTKNALRAYSEGFVWRKFTLSHTAFQTAGLTNTIELFSLPAGNLIHAVKIKHSQSFSGGSIATYQIQVGITGTLGKYSTNFNVFQAVADAARKTTMVAVASLADESPSAATSIKVTATSTVGNLNASTQGSVDIWVMVSNAA